MKDTNVIDMFGSAHNTRNRTEHYHSTNSKQRRNWCHNTRQIERNEELRAQYPPYYSPKSNNSIVHLHYRTDLATIEQLIERAKHTTKYTIDTESIMNQHSNHGALVQIKMIQTGDNSTVILVEAAHLPAIGSPQLAGIQRWWSIIFDGGNKIIAWSPALDELKNFQHIDWMKLGNIRTTNLQFLFLEWQDG